MQGTFALLLMNAPMPHKCRYFTHCTTPNSKEYQTLTQIPLLHQRGSANDSNSTLFVKLNDTVDTWIFYIFNSQLLVVCSELKIKYSWGSSPHCPQRQQGGCFDPTTSPLSWQAERKKESCQKHEFYCKEVTGRWFWGTIILDLYIYLV